MSNFYLSQPGSESIQVQNDLKSYCDEAYQICLTEICVSPDPEAKKKCMDRCYKDFLECKNR